MALDRLENYPPVSASPASGGSDRTAADMVGWNHKEPLHFFLGGLKSATVHCRNFAVPPPSMKSRPRAAPGRLFMLPPRLVDQHLQCVVVGRVAENVVRLKYLIERERVSDELIGR
jgi:hypothetical protein